MIIVLDKLAKLRKLFYESKKHISLIFVINSEQGLQL